MRVGVTAIHDAVQVDVLRTHVLGHLQHAVPVVGMAVDAAGADQTHQVDGLAGVDGSFMFLTSTGFLSISPSLMDLVMRVSCW